MENFGFSETIALLALIVAFGSLAWNIVRDFVSDRMKIDFSLSVGESGNIRDSSTGLFADAGIFKTPITGPKLLLTITNAGRRHIFISRVGGKFVTPPKDKDKSHFSMVVEGLPRKLEPYEVYSTIGIVSPILLSEIPQNNIKSIWVEDTSGKKWELSSTGWERLEETIGALNRLGAKT